MNIEELALTEEEMKEDKSYAFLEFLSQASPTKRPEVTFVVAQPGAGKTGLAALSTIEIKNRNNGTLPVNVNADRVAEYHRNYTKLLDYKPEDRFRITRQFVNPTIKEIQKTLSQNRVSMIIECTLNSTKKIEFMKKLKQMGYRVNINVMVVDELESRMSCLEREVSLLKLGHKARGIDRPSHDSAYVNMVQTLGTVVQENCWDIISLFRRGNVQEKPVQIYETQRIGDVNVTSNINKERQSQRLEILRYPEKYLSRLDETRKSLILYQTNAMLRKYSIDNLDELKSDFLKQIEKKSEVQL